MLDIYLTQFAVKGRTRKALIGDLKDWIVDSIEVDVDELEVDGEVPGESVRGRWLVEGPPDNPSAIDISITRETAEGLVVVERIEISTAKRPLVRAALSVAPSGDGRPFYGGMYPPAFVTDLVSRGLATDASFELRSDPRVVTPDQVDDLFKLLQGNRRLPVVCFSEDPDESPAIDPGRSSALFAGAAHPVLLTYDAAIKFTQLRDKRWSTYLGAVRVYRPGLDWSSSARIHPLWITFRHPEPGTIPDAARQICVEEARWSGFDQWTIPRQRLDRVRARVEASESEDWLELLEEVESERDELRRETESLRTEIERLVAEARGESTVPPPSSISEALALISERSVPGLHILDSAWSSAANASFRRPERALEVLEAVAELAEAYNTGDLEDDFRSYLSERGVKLGYVSSIVRGRWPQDYQRSYDGRTVELSDHAKVGTGSPENHFRVYWYRDDENRVLVVGHVGDHLTNPQT